MAAKASSTSRKRRDIFVASIRPIRRTEKPSKRFGSLVLYRMKDAIAKEQRERRTPDDIVADKSLKKEKAEGVSGKETVDLNASVGPKSEETEEIEASNGEGIKAPDADADDGLIDVDERLDVERILGCVRNERKRLAFHLFMNGAPFKTKRENVESIAEAIGISERTAREWVKEVQLLLAQNDGVKHLRNLRAGERS